MIVIKGISAALAAVLVSVSAIAAPKDFKVVSPDGKVAEYVAMARRSGDVWYVGAMTDWNRRKLPLDLSFLGEGEFMIEVFRDGANADKAARDYVKETMAVPASRKIDAEMAPGGGFAARIYRK